MLKFALALLLALCLTACGGETGSNKPGPVTAQLRITVWPQGEPGPSNTYLLDCPDAASRAARTACIKLSRVDRSAFQPVPPATACTEIYGGPQTASVHGTLDGEPIDATFARDNGCEIARWDRLAFLFELD
jgi:hypothetical protein